MYTQYARLLPTTIAIILSYAAVMLSKPILPSLFVQLFRNLIWIIHLQAMQTVFMKKRIYVNVLYYNGLSLHCVTIAITIDLRFPIIAINLL